MHHPAFLLKVVVFYKFCGVKMKSFICRRNFIMSMEKSWFQRKEKGKEKSIDVLKDVEAVQEGLRETPLDLKPLLKELEQLAELEKEYRVAKAGVLHVNLEAQAEILDKILQRYEYFQNDVDINGLRVKEIAREWLRRADKSGLKDVVKKKQQDMRWKMEW